MMIDLTALKQAAQIIVDERGVPQVQIPLSLWEELLDTLKLERPQHERITALLEQWAAQADDTPPGWWDEFDKFLTENPVNFRNPDLGSESS